MDTLVYGKNAPIVTCSNCECQFKYSTVDIFIDNAMGGDGQFVRCPECGQVNPATTQYFDPRGDDQFNPSETYPNMGVGKDDQGNIITETYATKVALQEEITAREEVDTEIYSKLNSAISSIQYSTDANDITRLSYTTFDSSPNTAIDIIINKATTTTSGLMPKEAVQEIADLSERVSDLEGPTRRYLYTGSDNPTADDINTFAISEGLSAPFSGIAVVVASTLHIWHYYTNGGWRDDGKDTVQTANQTTLGIVMGSTDNGKVFVETDGTMSLNGYDDITQNISDINSKLANIETTKANVSDLDNYVDLTTYQHIHGLKCFVQDNVGHSILQVTNQETGDVIEFGSTRISRKESSDGVWRSIQVPYINGVMATTNDITTSLSNYVSINGANYLSGTYRFDRPDTQPDAQISLFNVDTTDALLLTESSIGYRVGDYYNQLFFDTPTENTDLHVPNKSGTLATTNDITSALSNYVTTDTTQTITAQKYFTTTDGVGAIIIQNGDERLFSDGTQLSYTSPNVSKSVAFNAGGNGTYRLYFPEQNGTISTLNDITTSLSNYATLDTVQTFTERKNFREFGTNIPLSVFNNEEDKYLYLHPTYLSTHDGVTSNSVNMYFPNTSGTLATTESIANSYVTLNTTQNLYGDKYFHYDGTGYPLRVYDGDDTENFVSIGPHGFNHAVNSNILTINYPQKSGIIALINDITTAIQPIEEQVEELSYSVNDIYQILQQEVYTSQDIEQEYSSRETADGADIIDGALETVKLIEGSTVKTTNLIPYPYEGNTTTVNGVTYTNNNNGSVTINGTATGGISTFMFCSDASKLNLIPGTTYIVSGKHCIFAYTNAEGTTQYVGNGYIVTWDSTYTFVSIYLQMNDGQSETNLTVYPMLNEGSTAFPYMPYFSGLKNAYFKGLRSTGRNLLPYPYLDGASLTNNGVTFTVNSDGSITINGTPTDYVAYRFISDFRGVGEFILSGIPSSANLSFTFTAYNSAGDSIGSVDGKVGQTIQFNTSDYEGYDHALLQIRRDENNIAINNVTVYPMLNYGSSALPYEPYVSHEISLDTAIELPAWDSINPTTGKRIVQSNTLTFDGTESDWIFDDTTVASWYLFQYPVPNNLGFKGTSIICNKLPMDEGSASCGIYMAGSTNGHPNGIYIFFEKTDFPNLNSLDAWKQQLAAWNTAGDPLTVCYQTATATESDISMEDRLPAYKNGSEMVIQGDTDNSEYGAENTLTQNYAEVKGTTGGN